MPFSGKLAPRGDLKLKVIRNLPPPPVAGEKNYDFRYILRHGFPNAKHPSWLNQWKLKNLRHLMRGFRRVQVAHWMGSASFFGALWLEVLRVDGNGVRSREQLGLAGLQVVTDVGVGYIVDAFQNSVELEIMNFHGVGLGSTAENQTDTALVTELTTQYDTDNTRATGTTAEGATANIYQTVATNTFDAQVLLREHGVFNQAAVGGGVLLDRTVFGLITLENGESLQSTYELTLTAGS